MRKKETECTRKHACLSVREKERLCVPVCACVCEGGLRRRRSTGWLTNRGSLQSAPEEKGSKKRAVQKEEESLMWVDVPDQTPSPFPSSIPPCRKSMLALLVFLSCPEACKEAETMAGEAWAGWEIEAGRKAFFMWLWSVCSRLLGVTEGPTLSNLTLDLSWMNLACYPFSFSPFPFSLQGLYVWSCCMFSVNVHWLTHFPLLQLTLETVSITPLITSCLLQNVRLSP